jgi:ABC-type uncharacterized transport system ATPase subunit
MLTFLEDGDALKANEALKGYDAQTGGLTITVATDGRVSQTAEILKRLESAGIVATFAQRPPTLEEAFLTIVGEGAA